VQEGDEEKAILWGGAEGRKVYNPEGAARCTKGEKTSAPPLWSEKDIECSVQRC